MEPLFYVILIILVVVPIVLVGNISIFKRHHNVTGGVINYDPMMRKFVYKVNLTGKDIINLLQTTNDFEEFSCTFDFNRSVINFSGFGTDGGYFFQIQECDGFTILRLEQATMRGIPYKLNPFLVSKLQAEMLPYSQYSF